VTDLNKRWRWIAITGIFAAAIFILLLAFKPWEGHARVLKEDAVKRNLLEQYPGKINESLKKGGLYRMELETQHGIYEVELSAYDGEIVAMHQLKAYTPGPESLPPTQTTPEPTATPKPTEPVAPSQTTNGATATPSPTVKPTHTPDKATPSPSAKPGGKPSNNGKLLGEKKAGKLAAAHVKGKVKDVDFKRSKDGNSYYLVEVDVKKRGDAVVQVNAISGAIMSVVWEDEDDDDD